MDPSLIKYICTRNISLSQMGQSKWQDGVAATINIKMRVGSAAEGYHDSSVVSPVVFDVKVEDRKFCIAPFRENSSLKRSGWHVLK